MGIRSQIRGFSRAFRRGVGGRVRPRHSGDALGRTAKDALNLPGNRSGNFTGTQSAHDHVAAGADDYDKSFGDG